MVGPDWDSDDTYLGTYRTCLCLDTFSTSQEVGGLKCVSSILRSRGVCVCVCEMGDVNINLINHI